jgi:CDP-4-dehydro-6-deoxyglucose reductase
VSRISLPSGKSFESEAGETMLDAALRAGVTLEYSCRTGRCGSCKGQVRVGTSVSLHEETGLSAAEVEAGWVLTCARSATGDIELDIQDLGNIKLYPAKTVPARIHSLEKLSSDVVKVMLRLPPTQSFDYHAGQYLDVIGRDGLRRSYSIANTARADKQLELHIRQVPEGAMSAYWFGDAKANDLLRLDGPRGTFFLRDVAQQDLVFLATGTGIAPVKAMLESLASDSSDAQAQPRSITVYWGGRVQQDLYWSPAELALPLRYVPVLSRAGDDWAGARGHIQQVFLADRPDLSQTVVYACGSDAMINSARAQLLASGLEARRFHSDAFVCSS